MRADRSEIESYLHSKGVRFKVHGGWAYVNCPACSGERGLHVRLVKDRKYPVGTFTCWKCKEHGGPGKLRELFGDAPQQKEQRQSDWQTRRGASMAGIRLGAFKPDNEQQAPDESAAPSAGPFVWSYTLATECEERLWTPKGAHVLAYLRSRGFSDETLKAWNIGAVIIEGPHGVMGCVAIPVHDKDGTVCNVRFRTVPGTCPHCGGSGCAKRRSCDGGVIRKSYMHCTGRPLPLFGTGKLSRDTSRPVIIVEGELDVLAFYEYGFKDNVVSGTSGAGAFKDEWLDQLEPFSEFLLCYDNDEPGQEGAAKLAERLGEYRCSRIVLPRKDANDCLMDKLPPDLIALAIDNAQTLTKIEFGRADKWAEELEDAFANPNKLRGLPTGSAGLDAAIYGWRPGLYVMTGDTSSGKTSFATWCIDEQTRMGVPCMIASFEDRPIGVVQRLLRMELHRDPIECSADERGHAFAKVASRPLWILGHDGHMDASEVVDAIRFAKRRYGVRIALVDHLSYLYKSGGEDDNERGQIENAVRQLHIAGVQDDVTVILIAHPNRGWAGRRSGGKVDRVRIFDLKGASAIEQDCSCGLVVQRLASDDSGHLRAKVWVDKVRGNYGILDAAPMLYYDRAACTFAAAQPCPTTARTNQSPRPLGKSDNTC
jgi:5S rRNA maturation endonuclease (ribonuclease M5)